MPWMVGTGQGVRLVELLDHKTVFLQAVFKIFKRVHIRSAIRVNRLEFNSGAAVMGNINKDSDQLASLVEIAFPARKYKTVREQVKGGILEIVDDKIDTSPFKGKYLIITYNTHGVQLPVQSVQQLFFACNYLILWITKDVERGRRQHLGFLQKKAGITDMSFQNYLPIAAAVGKHGFHLAVQMVQIVAHFPGHLLVRVKIGVYRRGGKTFPLWIDQDTVLYDCVITAGAGEGRVPNLPAFDLFQIHREPFAARTVEQWQKADIQAVDQGLGFTRVFPLLHHADRLLKKG